MRNYRAEAIFTEYGIDYLYHITSIDNLSSILFRGILSHEYIQTHNLGYRDISDYQVQQIRNCKNIKGIPLHQYVPLYFNPRNPMLFARRSVQSQLAILGIDPVILFQPYTVISDGNAAADDTIFYEANIKNLSYLNWGIIRESHWSDQPDGKRIKCAEVLVYPRIAVAKILKIFCYSQQSLAQIKTQEFNHLNVNVEVNPNLYF